MDIVRMGMYIVNGMHLGNGEQAKNGIPSSATLSKGAEPALTRPTEADASTFISQKPVLLSTETEGSSTEYPSSISEQGTQSIEAATVFTTDESDNYHMLWTLKHYLGFILHGCRRHNACVFKRQRATKNRPGREEKALKDRTLAAGSTAEQAISQRRHDIVGDQLEGAVGELRQVRPERRDAIGARGLLRTELQAERAEAEELEVIVTVSTTLLVLWPN
ncbi:hypothetical protein HO133_001863 [Letharia lupina]|uniref:Uncharacterized protein n=1 Tax=Letharia lupina TaxID=560253 RepID=A0A8H6CE29_9LECA|nr:uncharacterized protein HO133_001863 [Letharia lupina]KAF6221895.1 hypothetical protein HO133_001863 [Letharia lupina]